MLIRHKPESLERPLFNQNAIIFPIALRIEGSGLDPFGLKEQVFGLLFENVGKNDKYQLKLTACI